MCSCCGGSLFQFQCIHRVPFSVFRSGCYRFVDLNLALCQSGLSAYCDEILGNVPSRLINHSAVAIWWAGIAPVILIWILWNGKYEQVVNASGRRINMMFTNAAWMEKCFWPGRNNLKCVFDRISLSLTVLLCTWKAHRHSLGQSRDGLW